MSEYIFHWHCNESDGITLSKLCQSAALFPPMMPRKCRYRITEGAKAADWISLCLSLSHFSVCFMFPTCPACCCYCWSVVAAVVNSTCHGAAAAAGLTWEAPVVACFLLFLLFTWEPASSPLLSHAVTTLTLLLSRLTVGKLLTAVT